jgi:hypothetical protein
MRTLENTLALWVAGLLTSGEVVDWANSAIARSADPSQDLFDLASDGPERCLKRAREDFGPRPATLGYAQEFSLRALATSLDSEKSAFSLAEWASWRCVGEDLPNPIAALGYRLDHLLNDCHDRPAALALLRAELPALMPLCTALAAAFLESGDR